MIEARGEGGASLKVTNFFKRCLIVVAYLWALVWAFYAFFSAPVGALEGALPRLLKRVDLARRASIELAETIYKTLKVSFMIT
jgi:hypothetical protein